MISVIYHRKFGIDKKAMLPVVLLLGFGIAIYIRLLVGGYDIAQSMPAALIFAFCLIGLTIAARVPVLLSKRSLLIGLAGGLFLCFPAVVLYLSGNYTAQHVGNYLSWAVVVCVVAFAEEAFLRGALYDAIKQKSNESLAIIIPAIAFAILHIPLYGWHILPLDLAVGVWLGTLRLVSGSFVAPAIAHTIADLVGWWL